MADELRQGSGTVTSGTVPAPLGGIAAIRRSLGFGENEEALVRKAKERLTNEIDGWVDRFYLRLLTDPIAMNMLDDEARVIRLKRSLKAWFHELFSMPFDERYELARESIGHTHVKIRMPQHLMVSATSGLRTDVVTSTWECYSDDPELARRMARALSLALDMELSLMLAAYRRQEFALARHRDRLMYTERALNRYGQLLRNGVDAALCYAEIASQSEDEQREEALVKLRDVLREIGRAGRPLDIPAVLDDTRCAPELVPLRDVCSQALGSVTMHNTRTRLEFDPPDLTASVYAEAVRLAIEELVQDAVLWSPGGEIVIRARRIGRDTEIEMTNNGHGWADRVRAYDPKDPQSAGLGFSVCEYVADLHRGKLTVVDSPSDVAGFRMHLRDA